MSDSTREDGQVIRAERCEIDLGLVVIDAYRLLNGEKRISAASVSEALGYAKNWFYRLQETNKKRLETLQGLGFTGYTIPVMVAERQAGVRGASRSNTVSTRDFIKLLNYEGQNGNKAAIVLLVGFAEYGLEQVIDKAFAGLDFEEFTKKVHEIYHSWTWDDYQEVLEYNREEARALNPWGN